jgi:hypothetical protein
MSFISAGIAGAGLALQVGSQAGLFGGAPTRPAFDYAGANAELEKYNKQLAATRDYQDKAMAESERQKAAVAAERDRQQALTGQANTSIQHEQGLYSNVPGQMDAKTKQLADYFATSSSALPTGGPTSPNAMPASTSTAVNADATGKLARVGAYNTQQNGALAGLRSFGDVWGDAGRAATQDQTHLSNIMNFKQGSKALLPGEIAPAYNLTPPPTPTADFTQFYSQAPNSNLGGTIAKGVGGIATGAGLSGWNPFGGLPSSGLGSMTGTAAGNAASAYGPVFAY